MTSFLREPGAPKLQNSIFLPLVFKLSQPQAKNPSSPMDVMFNLE